MDVQDLAHRIIEVAPDGGGELEAYVEHRVVTTVQAGTGGAVRHVGRADTRGVGVRAVSRDHVGYASTADVSDAGIVAVVAKARANAEVAEADPAGAQLPAPAGSSPVDGLVLASLTGMPLASKVSVTTNLARRATSLNPRVRRIDTAQWRDEHRRVAVSSSRGTSVVCDSAFAELWCDALGEDEHGAASDYGYWWGRDPGDVDVDVLAAEAVRRTLRLLGPLVTASPVESILFDPAVMGVILEAIGRALTGGALGNRRSPFAGRHGELVASPGLLLFDDGRRNDAPASGPFDDEGVPRRRTTLIENGVLTGALHSCATAASVGQGSSTGNARRVSYKSAPRAAPTTLCLESASSRPLEDDAVYVQQVAGSGTGISSVTGRVSVGAIGFLMRDGEPAGRLPTLPIASTLQALLQEVSAVGDAAVVVPDHPVMAPTVLWRPRQPLTVGFS
ncbi:MAG: TldD/PmbA family protein [Nocardioidaceae bacterium]